MVDCTVDCTLPSVEAGVTFPKRRINTEGRIKDGWLTLDRDPADPYRPYLRRSGPVRAHSTYGRSFVAELQVNGQRIRRVVRFTEDCMDPPLSVSVNGRSLLLCSNPPDVGRCGNGPDGWPRHRTHVDNDAAICAGAWVFRYVDGRALLYRLKISEPLDHATCNPVTAVAS